MSDEAKTIGHLIDELKRLPKEMLIESKLDDGSIKTVGIGKMIKALENLGRDAPFPSSVPTGNMLVWDIRPPGYTDELFDERMKEASAKGWNHGCMWQVELVNAAGKSDFIDCFAVMRETWEKAFQLAECEAKITCDYYGQDYEEGRPWEVDYQGFERNVE